MSSRLCPLLVFPMPDLYHDEMKYYRHYKDKPYKYIGLARHSETQEEMVIYETLYENSGGKIWVRPKQMFFESVLIEGENVPRFKKIDFNFEEFTNLSSKNIEMIGSLVHLCLGEWHREKFLARVKNRPHLHLIVASLNGASVGFKMGYGLSSCTFYSWIGGVHPEYRGLGLGCELMQRQHRWCETKGFDSVQTKTQNRYRSMLLLNLKHGFEIISTENSLNGLKIVLEKKISRERDRNASMS